MGLNRSGISSLVQCGTKLVLPKDPIFPRDISRGTIEYYLCKLSEADEGRREKGEKERKREKEEKERKRERKRER